MNVQKEIKEIYEKLGSINTRLTENRQLTGGFHNLLSATHQDTESASPLRGSIITGQTATPEWRRLVLGTTGQILKSDGTDIGWQDFGHDLLSAGHSDAGTASVAVGDLITGQAGPEWNRLAIGGSGTFLRSDGSAPSWASISSGDLPSHSHTKTDISDTPWAWTDVSKTGSVLNDIGNVNASPGDGDALVWVDASSEWQAGAGGGGAPTDAPYLCIDYDTGLSAERKITEGAGIKFTDGGANSTFTIASEFHETIGTETGNLLTQGYIKGNQLWVESGTADKYMAIRHTGALTANHSLTIDLNDADRIIDLEGGLYVQGGTVYLDQSLREQDSPTFDALYLRDTGSDHGLRLYLNENLTANRTLNIYVDDADRYLYLYNTLQVTGFSYINQDLRTTASPTFQNLRIWDSAGQDYYINLDVAEALSTNRTISIITGDAARTFSLQGSLYISGTTYADQDLRKSASPEFDAIRITAGGGYYVEIEDYETLTGNRSLTLDVNDGARTLDMAGDLYVESTSRVNQDLTTDADVDFADITASGDIYMANAKTLYCRNQADSGNVRILQLNTNDHTTINSSTGKNIILMENTSAKLTLSGGYITLSTQPKSGATQAAAGAAAGEIWKTASHASLPDNVLMIGV